MAEYTQGQLLEYVKAQPIMENKELCEYRMALNRKGIFIIYIEYKTLKTVGMNQSFTLEIPQSEVDFYFRKKKLNELVNG